MDALDFIMTYEAGECTANEVVDGFAQLVSSGTAWHLQGSYGRAAAALIERGFIDRAGNILRYPEPE